MFNFVHIIGPSVHIFIETINSYYTIDYPNCLTFATERLSVSLRSVGVYGRRVVWYILANSVGRKPLFQVPGQGLL
jgi:hypothetical protein